MSPRAVVAHYMQLRDRYWQNAHKMLAVGEYSKASEMLYGATVESIKAYALATKGARLSTHVEVRAFMREASKEIGDDGYYSKAFSKAERLHADFFEGLMTAEEVHGHLEATRELLAKLESDCRAAVSTDEKEE